MDERTTDNRRAVFTVCINMWTVSSDVSIERRHWQPLLVHLWACCTHPTHDVNDVWRLATPPGSTSPTLFEQWCGFFYVPQEPDKCKGCETEPTVFRPYHDQRRLGCLTVCRCRYKGSTFFSVIQRPWVLVWLGFEPVASRSADRRSPNWANQAKGISTIQRIVFLVEMKSDLVSYESLFTLRWRVAQRPLRDISDDTLSRSARHSFLRSRLWTEPLSDVVSVPAQGVSVYKI